MNQVYRTPIIHLSCAVCGESTIGRQWYNRDTGFGICSRCVPFARQRMTPHEFNSCYGVEGVHFNLPEDPHG